MADGLKVGDAVQLHGGGPIMTIVELGTSHGSGKPTVWTVWFEGAKEHRGSYPVEAVKRYHD